MHIREYALPYGTGFAGGRVTPLGVFRRNLSVIVPIVLIAIATLAENCR